jgi:hydrogenase nickel incorporation protein HypA/HybF
MHEWSICESLVRAVRDELGQCKQGRPRLVRARVAIGGLHQVVPDNLLAAYEALTRETDLAGSALCITHLPVTAVCDECGWSGEVKPPLFVCGACGRGRLRLTGGKELALDRIEVEVNDEPDRNQGLP